MDQAWLEMQSLRRRRLDSAVWIPLRSVHTIESEGKYGYLGHKEEFFGVGTLAVPLQYKDKAAQLKWSDLGIRINHRPYVQEDKYIPADTYLSEWQGTYLALAQRTNSLENEVWHLHQDLVIGLGLKREEDEWLCIDEDYDVAARLKRSKNGKPVLLEIKAEYLKDYLASSKQALYVTSYRRRTFIAEQSSLVDWDKEMIIMDEDRGQWRGHIYTIHEGGTGYGNTTAIIHMSRTDIDPEEDVPVMGDLSNDNIVSHSWTKKGSGRKLFSLEGELWVNEWVESGTFSPRIREDERPANIYFTIDAAGNQSRGHELKDGRKWIWFRPEVIMALAHRRGGKLEWYTRDTGKVACSPDYAIDFGMNTLGLITVYAKDIANLPEWQQRIWAGYNITPNGGVSTELLDSQVNASPAMTQAPEEFLFKGIYQINKVSLSKLGFSIFLSHENLLEIIQHTHRFRAVDRSGLFALAKDIARLTADSINVSELHTFLTLPKQERLGSLKTLERLLATIISKEAARRIMGPLVGAYELRLGDAHLPSSSIEDAFELVKVDKTQPVVIQGYQLLATCVTSLWKVVEVMGAFPSKTES